MPHALAYQLHEIDHLEGPIALVGAELAVAGVVDPGQRVDPGLFRRGELFGVHVALVVGQHRERVAHIAHAGLREVDEFEPGDRPEDRLGGLGDAGDARVFVQPDPLFDPARHQRAEIVEPALQPEHEGREVEGRIAGPFMRLQRGFPEMDLAARAPGQHLVDAGLGEPVDGAPRQVGEFLQIARAELVDAAAIARPAAHRVLDPERVQDVEAEERDMGRLEDVAAGVEDRFRPLRLGRERVDLAQPRQQVGRKLETAERPHALAHRAELLAAAGPQFLRRAGASEIRDAGERQHEARVDAVFTGRDAMPAAGADLRPAARDVRPLPGPNQVDHAGRHGLGVGNVEPGRPRHRTNPHAFAAFGAGVENAGAPHIQRGEEILRPVGTVGHVIGAL